MMMKRTKSRFTTSRPYFVWLYSHIGNPSDKNPEHSHWILADLLYGIVFTWDIPNDDNRADDGIQLRYEFCEETGTDDFHAEDGPCTVLEMLIALAKRLDFLEDGGAADWFWIMVDNLGLLGFTDQAYVDEEWFKDEVYDIIDIFLCREFEKSGVGGIFPLRHPRSDQRKVEIWYQMHAYLLENRIL